jgi:hypothetical protein
MDKRLDDLADKVREIADIIGKRPVLGHWPANRAELDQRCLILAASALVSLSRELGEVAKLGHQLMMAQATDNSAGNQA